jgi:hypothetical protein
VCLEKKFIATLKLASMMTRLVYLRTDDDEAMGGHMLEQLGVEVVVFFAERA